MKRGTRATFLLLGLASLCSLLGYLAFRRLGSELGLLAGTVPLAIAMVWRAVDLRDPGPATGMALGNRRLAMVWAVLGVLALGLACQAFGVQAAKRPVSIALVSLLLLATLFEVARLTVQLREASADGRPAPWIFFLVPLLVYLALDPWLLAQRPPDGDEPWYLLLTHSIAFDADIDLENQYEERHWRYFMEREIAPQPGDPTGPDGEMYSRHDALLPVLLAPFYRFAGLSGVVFVMSLLSALLALFSLRLAQRYLKREPGAAVLAWWVLAMTPPLVLYAHQVWVEVPAALLLVVALLVIDRLRHQAPTRGDLAALAVLLVTLPLLKLRFVLVSAGLAALVAVTLWRGRRERQGWAPGTRVALAAALIVLATAGAALLAYNQRTFGNPLKIHRAEDFALAGLPLGRLVEGGLGLFWDAGFGLLAASPIWLVVLPAIILVWRGRSSLFGDLVLAVGPYLLAVTTRTEWYGGWSPPFRYGLVALPILTGMLAFAFTRRRQPPARLLIAPLFASSVMIGALYLAEPGWTFNLADGRNHAISAIEARTSVEVTHLLPSYVRPRLASWIWPSVLALLSCLLILPRRASTFRLPRATATPEALGLSVCLLAAGCLLRVAAAQTTQTIEPESSAVRKSGGQRDPERWMWNRRRFDESWVLAEGQRLEARVRPASENVALVLRLRAIHNHPHGLVLRVLAGDLEVARFDAGPPELWHPRHIAPFTWQDGDALVVEVLPTPREHTEGEVPVVNGVAIDHIELDWR